MRSFAPPLLLNNAFFLRSRVLTSLVTQYTVHQSTNNLHDSGASRFRQHISGVIMMSTTMKTDASVVSKIYTPTPTIIGGDYAGLHATFSSDTGELVPIPQHLVPRSMIEWGDIPNSFDTLVSEDLYSSCTDNDDDNGRKGGIWSL